jgi:hypothetical protein
LEETGRNIENQNSFTPLVAVSVVVTIQSQLSASSSVVDRLEQ